ACHADPRPGLWLLGMGPGGRPLSPSNMLRSRRRGAVGPRSMHGRGARPAPAERLPRRGHGMSLKVIADECIGCGGCEFACPTGALAKTDSFLGLFAIDPYHCDDCGLCVRKCPVDAIVPDP